MLINRIINNLKCIKINILELLGLLELAESPLNNTTLVESCFPVPIDPNQNNLVNPIVCAIPLDSDIISVNLIAYADRDDFLNEDIELLNITTQKNSQNLLVLANVSKYSLAEKFYICIRYTKSFVKSGSLLYNGLPLLYNGKTLIFTNL